MSEKNAITESHGSESKQNHDVRFNNDSHASVDFISHVSVKRGGLSCFYTPVCNESHTSRSKQGF